MSTLPVLLKASRLLLIGAGNGALHKAKSLKENQVGFELLSKHFVKDFQSYKCSRIDLGYSDMLKCKILAGPDI